MLTKTKWNSLQTQIHKNAVNQIYISKTISIISSILTQISNLYLSIITTRSRQKWIIRWIHWGRQIISEWSDSWKCQLFFRIDWCKMMAQQNPKGPQEDLVWWSLSKSWLLWHLCYRGNIVEEWAAKPYSLGSFERELFWSLSPAMHFEPKDGHCELFEGLSQLDPDSKPGFQLKHSSLLRG